MTRQLTNSYEFCEEDALPTPDKLWATSGLSAWPSRNSQGILGSESTGELDHRARDNHITGFYIHIYPLYIPFIPMMCSRVHIPYPEVCALD
jgi:hypothetical protein